MRMKKTIGRRGFIAQVAALGAAGLAGLPASAAKEQVGRSGPAAGGLPARGEFVVRKAYVMTMDPALGDIPDGDVHVKNGAIMAIGKELKAPTAAVIEGSGTIVLPGLVETHWHMWNTLLRSFAGEKPDEGYFPTAAAFGKVMTPDDMRHGTRLAAAEALHSGITTVHDYCHNVRSREHAEADIRALREAGLRARWSYGWPQGLPDSEIANLGDLRGLHRDWAGLSNDGLISLGLGWRGMFRPSGPLPPEIYRKEFETARELGIPISTHIGSAEDAKGQVAAHAKENLLGKDVQLIHVLSASPAEIQMIASAGSPVSVSPGSELRIGYGFTKTGEFLDAGVTVGISIDTTELAGNANLFGLLKLVREIENAKSHNEFRMSARRVLELGTIEGAKSLGMDGLIGSLKPGKRADLLVISTRHLNMGVFTDPAHLLVEATQPENVDMVVIDGRILKRGGRLTALPVSQIMDDAASSLAGIRKRANWR
jgi:5-methylthioadenosine/S-adenosylhomocysteine deaminase